MNLALLSAVMAAAALVALSAAVISTRSPHVRARREFVRLQLAIAVWAGTAAMELRLPAPATELLIAKVQYLGIAPLPVFFFTFAGTYTHRLTLRRSIWVLLWVVPLGAIIAAFTNDAHHLLWRDIQPNAGAPPTFVHGPVFWLNWLQAQTLIAISTVWLLLALRHYTSRYRATLALLLVGVGAPWIANLAYIFLGSAVDFTPIAFAVTACCFLVSMLSR